MGPQIRDAQMVAFCRHLSKEMVYELRGLKNSYAVENIHTPVCLHGMHRDNFIVVFNGLHLYVW